jgi:RHS repeat-associated protein
MESGKEGDTETGLDYFGARYFSAAQGRFTSPDPVGIMKQKMLDPQQWNMYAYGRNNPLRFIDPTGRYNTDCKGSDITKCSAQIQAFEANRQKDLKSSDEKVHNAAAAYGGFNDKNKVNLKFDPKAKDSGTAIQDRDASGNRMGTITVTLRGMSVGPVGEGTVAHEGSHVMDFMKVMGGAKPMTLYQTEMTAFQVNFAVLKDVPGGPSLGFRGGYTFLAPLGPEAESANRTELIKMLGGPDYGLTEKEQGGNPYVRP